MAEQTWAGRPRSAGHCLSWPGSTARLHRDGPPTATLPGGPVGPTTLRLPWGARHRQACPGHPPASFPPERPLRQKPSAVRLSEAAHARQGRGAQGGGATSPMPTPHPPDPPQGAAPPPVAGALTGAAMRTLAVEGGHSVVAGGPVEAGGAGTVIDVLAAVFPRPAVDAHAVVAAVGVVAGPAVLAGVGHQLALVYVLGAVLACGGPARHASTTGPGGHRPREAFPGRLLHPLQPGPLYPRCPRPPGLAGPWPRRSAVGSGAPGGPHSSAIPSLAEAQGTRLWRGPAWGAARDPHRRADGREGASAPPVAGRGCPGSRRPSRTALPVRALCRAGGAPLRVHLSTRAGSGSCKCSRRPRSHLRSCSCFRDSRRYSPRSSGR